MLQEREEELVGALNIRVTEAMKDSRGSIRTEASLAGAHPQAQHPAHVVEVHTRASTSDVEQASARHQLALADELVVGHRRLLGGEARAEPVVVAVLRTGQGLARGRAGALGAHLRAHRIDHGLRHQPVGGELAPGDREETRHAVVLEMIDEREAATHVVGVLAMLARVRIFEQRT